MPEKCHENPFAELGIKLAYVFQNPLLIRQALTHRSYSKMNNERLEFLGDAVLGLLVGELLYKKFPEADEGQLSRCRSKLVKGETLALLGEQLQLESYILVGAGEKGVRENKLSGKSQQSILANVFEAVIGAVYLDTGGDIAIVRNVIGRLYQDYLGQLNISLLEKDPKTSLQELCQAKQLALPQYLLIKEEGKAHNKVFTISCVTSLSTARVTAKARSRRKAEQKAASLLLDLLHQDNTP